MPTTPIRRVRTVHTGIAGSPFLTTAYFTGAGEGSTDPVAAMAAFWDEMSTHISSDLVSEVLGDVDVVEPVSGDIIGVENFTGETITHNSTSSLLSLGTQGLLNLRTGFYAGSREVRGKLYVPGVTVLSMASGNPNSTFQGALLAAFVAMQAMPNADMVVYSPTHGQWQPIASPTPSSYFARLRTRQR